MRSTSTVSLVSDAFDYCKHPLGALQSRKALLVITGQSLLLGLDFLLSLLVQLFIFGGGSGSSSNIG